MALLGEYAVQKVLRSGGANEVLLAERDGRRVVVKRGRSENASDALRLAHEGEIGARLSQENLVPVVERGPGFVVFEWVAGRDLRDVFGRVHALGLGELPRGVAVAIVHGVARALAHAHTAAGERGVPLAIVHRDVSPPNILVGDDGVVRLLDFGFAQSTLSRLPEELGTVPGRPGYVSPEQARGERVDARSDLFALGIVLFELTTGRRLYRGRTDYETLCLVRDREVPRPSEIRHDYPPELDAIVLRALAKEPAARIENAGVLARALEPFAAKTREVAAFVHRLDEGGCLSKNRAR